MEAPMVDYQALSRKELQALCKQHKIPANKTNLFMADSLAALLGNVNASAPEVVDAPISGAKEANFVGMTEAGIVPRTEESVGEAPSESPADDADNTIAVVKKASKGRVAKKTAAPPTPVGLEDVCSAVKPATKRATVRGKVSSLAKLTAVETCEGSDEAEAKPAGRNGATKAKTTKLSDLKEDSCVTQQEPVPEDMAAEVVADSEAPAAPGVEEMKKAVRGKRTGKKAQVDAEEPVVETTPMVNELEAMVLEEAPVVEEAIEAALVPEVLVESKKVRGKRVGKKAQVDEFLQTEPVETAPMLNEAMVEEEAHVEEPVELSAVETKKVRAKRVGKKAQMIAKPEELVGPEPVETALILAEVILEAESPQIVEDRAVECVADPEAPCEEAPVAEVKKVVKGKRGGRKAKVVAQKVELPELTETEAVDEEAEQATGEVQEKKTVKAIVSQFEQLTVGVVAEEIDDTPVVETDAKMQEIAVAQQVEDMDHVDDNIAEAVPEMEQSALEEVELPKAAAKKAAKGKKAAKEKAVKGKAGKAKDGAVAQASPPAIEIYCDIVVDKVEEAENPIPELEEPSSPVHGAGHLALASPVKSPSLAHLENDSGTDSADDDEAPTPLVHNMQRGSRKDQNMTMEVVDKENAVKSNIGDYPQSLRKLRKQLKEAIIKKKGSTPLASPLRDISLNVQSPRVEQSPTFSFQC